MSKPYKKVNYARSRKYRLVGVYQSEKSKQVYRLVELGYREYSFVPYVDADEIKLAYMVGLGQLVNVKAKSFGEKVELYIYNSSTNQTSAIPKLSVSYVPTPPEEEVGRPSSPTTQGKKIPTLDNKIISPVANVAKILFSIYYHGILYGYIMEVNGQRFCDTTNLFRTLELCKISDTDILEVESVMGTRKLLKINPSLHDNIQKTGVAREYYCKTPISDKPTALMQQLSFSSTLNDNHSTSTVNDWGNGWLSEQKDKLSVQLDTFGVLLKVEIQYLLDQIDNPMQLRLYYIGIGTEKICTGEIYRVFCIQLTDMHEHITTLVYTPSTHHIAIINNGDGKNIVCSTKINTNIKTERIAKAIVGLVFKKIYGY